MSFDSINIKQYSLIMKWLLYQLLGSYFRASSCFTFTPPMACRNMNHSGMWTSNSQWARLKLCFTYSYLYCQHIGRWKQLEHWWHAVPHCMHLITQDSGRRVVYSARWASGPWWTPPRIICDGYLGPGELHL